MSKKAAVFFCAALALAAAACLWFATSSRPRRMSVVQEIELPARLPPPPPSAISEGAPINGDDGEAAEPPHYTNEMLIKRLTDEQKRLGMRIIKPEEEEAVGPQMPFPQRMKAMLAELSAMKQAMTASSPKKVPTYLEGHTAELIDNASDQAGTPLQEKTP